MLPASAIERSVGDFLKQDVRFAVDHPIPLCDHCLSDSLSQVTLTGAGWTQKQSIFMARHELSGGQIENQAPIHLLVEIEIEVVERFLWITELRLFSPPFQQSVAAASEFIGHQAGEEVDRRHWFRLGLV